MLLREFVIYDVIGNFVCLDNNIFYEVVSDIILDNVFVSLFSNLVSCGR